MIIELNKLYVLSAPQAAEGMTEGEDAFLEANLTDVMYVKMKKINQASVEKPVRVVGKVFRHSDKTMQALMYFTDYPEHLAKAAINRRIGELLGRKSAQ